MKRLGLAMLLGLVLTAVYAAFRGSPLATPLHLVDFAVSIIPAITSGATFHETGNRAVFWIGVAIEMTLVAYLALSVWRFMRSL